MKTIKYILLLIVTTFSFSSCHDLLTEIPKDFLTPENSYTDKKGFESSLGHIYLSIRNNFLANTDSWQNYDLMGIDVDLASQQEANNVHNEYFRWNTLNADSGFSSKWWKRFYNYIFLANTIIERADSELVKWTSEEEKNSIVGEAKFLRAYAYHFLANMWGGVPIVLTETKDAAFDYTRATREAVYTLCKEDLVFAAEWMPEIDEQKGGRASKVAANHLLTEVLICMKDYKGAIAAADKAIGAPGMNLMTERFGKLKDFEFEGYDYQGEKELWGDVYFDLFRENNFNRIDGNNETIWNVQFDLELEGGGNVGTSGGYFVMERWWGSNWWGKKDINGDSNWLKDILGGRPVGAVAPTPYASTQIWEFKDDWNNDIRNSKYNMQREYYWTNPAGEFYGELMTAENFGDKDLLYHIEKPRFMKAVAAMHHGQFKDSQSGETHDNGRTYKDWYLMRLAETYLLRAEAYHLDGDNVNAAKSINIVRDRANATPVVAGDINLDLILDERARELYMEENRLNTLMRMDKLVEYLMKYNPKVIQEGNLLKDHLNKFPIPNSEIEANKDVLLEQNPGY